MIFVDALLCAGCGVCVDECPAGAIGLSDGRAVIDAVLCDDCGACVPVCPSQALALAVEPPVATVPELSLALTQPSTEVIRIETPKPVPWLRAVLPAVGGALIWVGRELVPQLVPIALDALEITLDRRISRFTKRGAVRSVNSDLVGKERRQRHRHRRGRSQG